MQIDRSDAIPQQTGQTEIVAPVRAPQGSICILRALPLCVLTLRGVLLLLLYIGSCPGLRTITTATPTNT